jgi:hypothetical protein
MLGKSAERPLLEPFISRAGRFLFFNNRNEPAEQTSLFVARRVDEDHSR